MTSDSWVSWTPLCVWRFLHFDSIRQVRRFCHKFCPIWFIVAYGLCADLCIFESLERPFVSCWGLFFARCIVTWFFKVESIDTRCLFKDLGESSIWEVQFTGQTTLRAQSHCPWKEKGSAILQVTREPGAGSRFRCPPYSEFLNMMEEANWSRIQNRDTWSHASFQTSGYSQSL